MTGRAWDAVTPPRPARRALTEVAPLSPAERAAALEAEAAALGVEIARGLAAIIAEAAAAAQGLATLNGISPEVRSMAENLKTDLGARAAALTKLLPSSTKPEA